MLRVTTLYATSAAATAKYYTRYLTDAPGELPGRWCGQQADLLGLSGTVSTEAMERLLSGCDPVSGVVLSTDRPPGSVATVAGCTRTRRA